MFFDELYRAPTNSFFSRLVSAAEIPGGASTSRSNEFGGMLGQLHIYDYKEAVRSRQ